MVTPKDLDQLKENYFQYIIDTMDYDGLCQLAYDALSDGYKDSTWDEITEEVAELYNKGTLIDLLPEATSSETVPNEATE